jgi:hypothetical protein
MNASSTKLRDFQVARMVIASLVHRVVLHKSRFTAGHAGG